MANSLDFDQALNELDVLLQSDFSAAQKKLAEYETAFSGLTPTQKGRLRIDRAISYIFVSEYAKALDDLRQAETLITSPELLASIYSYQATVYIGMRDYDKALSAVAKALALVVNIDDVTIKRHSYLRIANIYSEMDAYSDMGLYANKVLQLAQEADVRDICHAKLLRAIYLLGVKSPDAFDAFEDSRQYCDAKQFPLLATMSMKGKGMVLQERGDYLGARAILLLALKGYEAFQFQLEISHVHALLAENYFATGELVQAKSHAVKVLTFPDDNSYIEHKHIAYKVFAELMAADKQFEQAYEYSRKEQHYNQLIFDESKMKTLAYQAAKFNADEQAREINLLNKERELYIAQQTVKEREYTNMLMFITILVGGLFFLAILLVVGNLQKRRFMRMARMDALTGVLNRGAGQDLGENLFVQAAARGGDFCVILFDLDHFKRINDSYGHGTGDWALKKVVEALKPHVRNGDVFARIGGEEFALFLPYANESKGMEVAEQCRSRIEAIDTHLSGHKFTITASFGVSGMTKEDLSLDPLLHRADMALYAAKSNGRNSVFCYEDALASDKRATNITSQLARQ
ncbi:GGDEF domain-containing protein [Shewanella sp. GD03713]|uniref:tetratricopeptide repeat-containing diguanylate cyclase n=1 Tax=Shewanella sp. GD03713 TaxID=2975372 RepID=UPI000B349CD2|nr:GGDEF domain-containing protein [Shewanella sp. GD03713]MDH1471230.1 GGDEF domain-containing protein [Shewanella sp. GD03713]QXN26140.1 GGDEF domain-containing protein [Shewanella putrefaciens]VEE60847.1 Diguanylate cyclase DosC [Shewanella putrefaciens]